MTAVLGVLSMVEIFERIALKRPQFHSLCGPARRANLTARWVPGRLPWKDCFDLSRRLKLQTKAGETLCHGVIFADASSPSRRVGFCGGRRCTQLERPEFLFIIKD